MQVDEINRLGGILGREATLLVEDNRSDTEITVDVPDDGLWKRNRRVSVAKQVRTDTAIGSSPVSVAFAAVNMAKRIFSNFEQHTAMVIGAGETIELVARHLKENGLGRIIVANRTVERAHAIAQEFDGYAIALEEIPAHLAEADIVISSTASPLPILGKGAVESAIKARKRQPMLMVDIAVPRDIEEQVGELEDVYLYTVDDLQEVIQDNLRSRQEAAEQAKEIIEQQTLEFMNAWEINIPNPGGEY